MPFRFNPFTRGLDYVSSYEEIEDVVRDIAPEGVKYVKVNAFADLPDPADHVGSIRVVLNRSVNLAYPFFHRKGLYYSSGTAWKKLGKALTLSELSNPPVGMHKITNLFWNPVTKEVEVDFDNNPKK